MQGLTPRAALLAAVLAIVAGVLTSCGSSGPEGDPSMQTTVKTPFKITTEDGKKLVVGHGVVLTIPEKWGAYEDEFAQGTAWEYAVGEPETATPFPAGLQLSMGMPSKGGQYDQGLPRSAEDLASLSPGYELKSKGKADVPGAEAASYFRFVAEQDYQGASPMADQVTLIIKMRKDVTSTIRFIAPEGDFDTTMKDVYDSVRVAMKDS